MTSSSSRRFWRFGFVALGLVGLAACNDTSPAPTRYRVEALLQRVESELNSGQLDSAQSDLTRALRLDPRNVTALYDKGVLDHARGDDTAALVDYDQTLAVQPSYVPALYNSAEIRSAKDPQRAIDLYRRILTIQKDAPLVYLNLGLLEYQTGRQDQAAADLDVALIQRPSLRSRLTADQLSLVQRTSGLPHPTTTTP